MKQKIRSTLRRINRSSIWERNAVLRGVYASLHQLAKLLFMVLHYVRHAKNLVLHSVYRIKILRRIRNNLNPRGVFFQLASLATATRLYRPAYKLVSISESFSAKRKVFDIEFDNETRGFKSNLERLINLDKTQSDLDDYRRYKPKRKAKTVVVSAISGGYDDVRLPAHINPEYDYVLYTDNVQKDHGLFEIRRIPYYQSDPSRMARYIKTNLGYLLPEYDYIIWVDGNITIQKDIGELVDEFINSDKTLAAIPHPHRSSPYEEARACIKQGKDDTFPIKQQVEFMKNQNFDSDSLVETGFMMFNMQKKEALPFFKAWWTQLNRFSRRDQISINYAASTSNASIHFITKKPIDVRTHPSFTISRHGVNRRSQNHLHSSLAHTSYSPFEGESATDNLDTIRKSYQDTSIEIVYCVHNAYEDVKLCLASVELHREPNVSLIIIDDGSDKETKDFLKEFSADKSWVSLHRSAKGSGYTKAANRGLKLTSADLVILLNSDTIVTKDWTSKMAYEVFETPNAGIVGPLSSAAGQQSIPNTKSSKTQTATNEIPDGLDPEQINEYCQGWSTFNYHCITPLMHGFCLGLSREVLDTVGYFSEEHFPGGYGEENDYTFRAADAGFVCVLATNTYIYHAKSKSYDSKKRISLMREGSKKLQSLHGKDRVVRAIKAMEENPTLKTVRTKAARLYASYSSK